jgi:hypothetical protein
MASVQVKAFTKKSLPQSYLEDMRHMSKRECKFEIRAEYFDDSLEDSTHVIVVLQPCETTSRYQTRATRGRKHCVSGFLLFEAQAPAGTSLTHRLPYISLVCSSERHGGKLVRRAQKMARVMNAEHLHLHAVDNPKVIQFYLRHGFKHGRDACYTKFKYGKRTKLPKNLFAMSWCCRPAKSARRRS